MKSTNERTEGSYDVHWIGLRPRGRACSRARCVLSGVRLCGAEREPRPSLSGFADPRAFMGRIGHPARRCAGSSRAPRMPQLRFATQDKAYDHTTIDRRRLPGANRGCGASALSRSAHIPCPPACGSLAREAQDLRHRAVLGHPAGRQAVLAHARLLVDADAEGAKARAAAFDPSSKGKVSPATRETYRPALILFRFR